MTRVRLTSGLGFYGDNWTPVLAAIEHGNVQYVCSDHLSELTLAILQKDRQKDATAGFARDLLPMLTQLWPAASQRGVKFVLNAGGLNPEGAALALQDLFKTNGWRARIAVVTGDDVLDQIADLQASGEALAHMDSGADLASVKNELVFANVYLGAQPIAQALAQGADIVLTGRVADAALFLGPLIHEHGWAADDWDKLAQGIVVGHLLECSGQGAGGHRGAGSAVLRALRRSRGACEAVQALQRLQDHRVLQQTASLQTGLRTGPPARRRARRQLRLLPAHDRPQAQGRPMNACVAANYKSGVS